MALPPSAILLGAARWLGELDGGSLARARTALTSQPRYADLTRTQYEAALSWLRTTGLLFHGTRLPASGPAREHRARLLVFEAGLATAAPAWLADAAEVVPTADDVPLDVADVGAALGLTPGEVFAGLRAASGKVDTALRAAIGADAEAALFALLTAETEASCEHVALLQDGLGYDIVATASPLSAHLEVKGTVRRNRLTIYLSRNEHDVMRNDPDWHLVTVLVDRTAMPRALAIGTVDSTWIADAAPMDRRSTGRWEAARLDVPASAVTPGLPCLVTALRVPVTASVVATGCAPGTEPPPWLSPG